MKRLYAHCIFIYPNTFLQNCIVELNQSGDITQITPFEKEIAYTEFYSGTLFLIPHNIVLENNKIVSNIVDSIPDTELTQIANQHFAIYHTIGLIDKKDIQLS